MAKKILSTILLILITILGYSQIVFKIDTLFSFDNDKRKPVTIEAIEYESYVLAYTSKPDTNTGFQSLNVFKINEEGTVSWSNSFLTDSSHYAVDVEEALNGEAFILSTLQAEQGIYLLRLNYNGNLIWSRNDYNVNINGNNTSLFPRDFEVMNSGENFILGYMKGGNLNNPNLKWPLMIKIDDVGDTLWTKVEETSSSSYYIRSSVTQDNHVIAVKVITDPGNQNETFLVEKIDEQGNILWQQPMGDTSFLGLAELIEITPRIDSGVTVMTSRSSPFFSFESIITTFDKDGNTIDSQTQFIDDLSNPVQLMTYESAVENKYLKLYAQFDFLGNSVLNSFIIETLDSNFNLLTSDTLNLHSSDFLASDLDISALGKLSAIGGGTDGIEFVVVDSFYFNPAAFVDTVLPGDLNMDGTVNNYDIVPLGHAFGSEGPVRLNSTSDFIKQPATSWNETLPWASNYMYIDASGDGKVGIEDTTAISFNYSLTSNKVSEPIQLEEEGLKVQLEALESYAQAGDTVWFSIKLGDISDNADFYSVVSTFESDVTKISEMRYTMSAQSFYNSDEDVLGIQHRFPGEGKLDMGMTKTNKENANGEGIIGYVSAIVKDDLEQGFFTIKLGDISVHDKYYAPLPISQDSELEDTVYIGNKTDGIEKIESSQVMIYPNPVVNEFNINILEQIGAIRSNKLSLNLIDASGKIMFTQDITEQQTTFDVRNLSSGVYIIEISGNNVNLKKKVFVKK